MNSSNISEAGWFVINENDLETDYSKIDFRLKPEKHIEEYYDSPIERKELNLPTGDISQVFIVNGVVKSEYPENSLEEIGIFEDVKPTTDVKLEVKSEGDEIVTKLEPNAFESESVETDPNSKLELHLQGTQCPEIEPEYINKIFECQECKFKSNAVQTIKNHMLNASHRMYTILYFRGGQLLKKRLKMVSSFLCKCYSFNSCETSCCEEHSDERRKKITLYKCLHCDYCSEVNANVKEHMSLAHRRRYKCDRCDYETFRIELLERHARQSHTKRSEVGAAIENLQKARYQCQLCCYKSDKLAPYKRHLTKKHKISLTTGVNRQKRAKAKVVTFKCEDCDFSATSKRLLQKHANLNHKRETIYECQFCGFKVTRSIAFGSRNKKWRNDIMYECQLCSYKTFQLQCLKRHMKVKHDKESDWQFCNHNVPTLDRLERPSVKCQLCDFETSNDESLQRHFEVSHDVRRFFVDGRNERAVDVRCGEVTGENVWNETKIRKKMTEKRGDFLYSKINSNLGEALGIYRNRNDTDSG